MNIARILAHIYPASTETLTGSSPDYIVETDASGIQRITTWNLATPQPTTEHFAELWPAIAAAEQKAATEEAIRAAFSERMKKDGITIGGINLAADPDSLLLFIGKGAMLSLALQLGAITTATEQRIHDAAGTAHTMAAGQVATLLLQYGLAYDSAFAAMKAEIAALV